MIIVHHLNNSRSQRILWMLEELGVPYDIKRYQREPSMQAPASLRAVHPLGKSPVITDGERTLAESGAILEYLVDTYGKGHFRPAASTPERVNYNYFMHYAEGSLMPLLLMKLIFNRIPARLPFFMKPVGRAIAKGANTTLLEMSFPLEAAAARAPMVRGMPKLSAFLDRIHARPAYRRALEKGGPYELMK
jgi:glutathione S-transferase